ncbi:hypothetical protein [Streptomyces alboflavus]|uniref:hypothetical protein n=1 Tax=Streptomyces alboflavus TaxID=67267 RepID=UPI0036A5E955
MTCGNCGDIQSDGECTRCVLKRELHAEFGSTDSSPLAPLISALEAAEHPASALNWLHRPESGASLLRELLASGYPLSHELLDAFPHRAAAVHLRQMLVHVGVLTARDENVARTERWMRHCLDQAADHHKAVLHPYATWVVLRRVRHRSQTRGTSRSSAQHARSQVATALKFLQWLDGQDLTLATATQSHVDQWLAAGSTVRLQLRDFLRWTRRCRLSAELHVPWRPEGEPANFFDDDEQLALLTRCVSDPTLPADVRAAGAIVLLYGVSVTRVTRLTRHDIDQRDNGTYLSLGQLPVLMPPAIERVVRAQCEASASLSVVGRAVSGVVPWLFPGRLAGRPVGPAPLAGRLKDYGIDIRSARNTAVLALASDLPAPILSQILGIHINTAVDWGKYVKRDWTGYIQDRADERNTAR